MGMTRYEALFATDDALHVVRQALLDENGGPYAEAEREAEAVLGAMRQFLRQQPTEVGSGDCDATEPGRELDELRTRRILQRVLDKVRDAYVAIHLHGDEAATQRLIADAIRIGSRSGEAA